MVVKKTVDKNNFIQIMNIQCSAKNRSSDLSIHPYSSLISLFLVQFFLVLSVFERNCAIINIGAVFFVT